MGKLSDQVPELLSRMKLAARKHNIVDFAHALGILNQFNKPLLAKIVAAKVPVIIVTNENISKQKVLSVEEVKGALSHSVAFYAFGSKGFKTFGLIYLSTMKSSMIGFVNWVVPFNMDLFDGLEGTLMHEAIHAYLNLIGYNDSNRNLRQKIIDLWEIIWQQQDKFDKQELRVMNVSYYGEHKPTSIRTSNIEEIVCWSTYPVTRHMLRKVKMPLAEGAAEGTEPQNAFDYLMDIVAEYDKDRLAVNYLRKDKIANQELEAAAMLQLLKLRAAAGKIKFFKGGDINPLPKSAKHILDEYFQINNIEPLTPSQLSFVLFVMEEYANDVLNNNISDSAEDILSNHFKTMGAPMLKGKQLLFVLLAMEDYGYAKRISLNKLKFDSGGTVTTDIMSDTLLKRYDTLKSLYDDNIVILRDGDFYVTYRSDAEDVAAILSLEMFHEANVPFIRFKTRGTLQKELENDGQKVIIVNAAQPVDMKTNQPVSQLISRNPVDILEQKPDFKHKEVLMKAFRNLKNY